MKIARLDMMHPLDEMHDAVTVENFGFSSLNSDTQRKLTAVSSSLNDIKTCRLLSGEEEIEDRMEKLNRHKEQVKSDGKPWALRADALVGKNQRPFRYIAQMVTVFWPIDVNYSGCCYGWTSPTICVAGVLPIYNVCAMKISALQ